MEVHLGAYLHPRHLDWEFLSWGFRGLRSVKYGAKRYIAQSMVTVAKTHSFNGIWNQKPETLGVWTSTSMCSMHRPRPKEPGSAPNDGCFEPGASIDR